MADLSVLIPARNEMFLRHTVEDILTNMRGDTNIIVVMDGAWADPPLEIHDRVQVLYNPESMGQRAATNQAAKLSQSQYLMKLDAHCSMAEGFDVELMATAETLPENVVQVPAQYNLHAFDWKCKPCGQRTYQGPTLTVCTNCGATEKFQRVHVWKPRLNRRTEFWRFDPELKFNYWSARKTHPESQGEIADTLSCLGACWFVSRARYWDIGGMDEFHGSWGQMGTEIGCKSWLSGGRLVVNKRTWFAHMFRTQGGDFGFPYPQSGRAVERARRYSQNLWRNHEWPKAVHSLDWLIRKFAPIPDWTDADIAKLVPIPSPPAPESDASVASKGIVYYSDCRGDQGLLRGVRNRLATQAARLGLRTAWATLAPIEQAPNIVVSLERGYLAMFKQILAGLEALDTDVAFLCEHDVLYDDSHFDFTPARGDRFYYNEHVWKVDAASGRALFYWCNQTSGLVADRQLLIQHYTERVRRVEAEGFHRKMGFEPGTHRRPHGVDNYGFETYRSSVPNVDIRHGHNLTPSRWRKDQFRNQKYTHGWTEGGGVPGWGHTAGRFEAFFQDHTALAVP